MVSKEFHGGCTLGFWDSPGRGRQQIRISRMLPSAQMNAILSRNYTLRMNS